MTKSTNVLNVELLNAITRLPHLKKHTSAATAAASQVGKAGSRVEFCLK